MTIGAPVAQRGASVLNQLARRVGVQRRYIDGMGQRRHASDDAVLAVLRAMGLPVERPDDAAAALASIDAEESVRLCEPVVVMWLGETPTIRLAPAAAKAGRLSLAVELETRERLEWAVEQDDLETSRRGDIGVRPPRELPAGTHRLSVTAGARTDDATLLVAPRRCYKPEPSAEAPSIGLFLPLYALRAESGVGVGTVGDLETLARWGTEAGADMVGTLPLLATFLDEPFEPSPYAPISRRVFSELYIDPERAANDHALPTLQDLLKDDAFTSAMRTERDRSHVDYRASWRLMRRCLDAAATDLRSSGPLRAEVESFGERDELTGAYASFRAGLVADATQGDRERWLYLSAQWILAGQMRSLSRSGPGGDRPLYLDLPVGAHGAGFDAAEYPDLHARGVSLGAPPDALFTKGQAWGFPPIIPSQSRAVGHALFAQSLDRHLAYTRALRIDHAAGLFRCFWAPDGFGATDGVYVHAPAEEHLALLSIMSHRHGSVMIGENLGTIPREVNRGLKRRGVLTMSIGAWDMGGEERALPQPDQGSLAALNTHDMPTFAAHWSGADIDFHAGLGIVEADRIEAEKAGRATMRKRVFDALRKADLVSAGDPVDPIEVLRGLLVTMAEAEPEILLINLEDLWLEPEPQNVPGIAFEYAPWRRKAARTLAEITSDPETPKLIARLRKAPRAPRSR